MNVATLRRHGVAVLLFSLAVATAWAAPGDPLGTQHRFGLGGTLDHDPYFQSTNALRGAITLSNGNVVVAWNARNVTSGTIPVPDSPDGANGMGDGAFFRVYNAGGTPLTPVTAPYLDINATGVGEQDVPIMAPLAGGGFVIAWNSAGGPGDTPAGDVNLGDAWGRVYANDGTPVSGTFHINENDPRAGIEDTQFPAAVVGLTGGGFAVVWSDANDVGGAGANTDDFFLRVFSATGVPAANSIRLGGAAQDLLFKDFENFSNSISLVALSNGSAAVGWGVRDSVGDGTGTSADGGGWSNFVQVVNASGASVAGPISPYADINPNTTGHQLTPFLAGLSGGGFAVTWNSNHNTDDGGNSDIGNGGNSTSGGDTWTRVFSNTGTSVSTSVRVNDNRNDDNEAPVDIEPLTGGGYAIVWQANEDVIGGNTDDFYVRAYTAAGAPGSGSLAIAGAGAEGLFDDYFASHGLAALSDGGFVAVVGVRDSANNGTGTSLDGAAGSGSSAAAVRVFNADGTSRAGPLFPYADINANHSGAQQRPRVAAVTGGFAVAWNSNANTDDGANSDVYQQSLVNGGDTWTRLYANAGTAAHATVRAHVGEPTGTDDEQIPIAVQRAGANYIVTIHDNNNATGNRDDYFLRAFGDTPTAPEIAVEQPAATNIADGGSKDFGSVNVGANTSLTFTIRNSGNANLTGLTITEFGGDTGDFAVTTAPTAPVAAAGTTTFVVQFAPTASGARSTTLRIASNDADENPFDLVVSGTGVALPNLTVNDITVTEGNAGTVNAAFVVTLSAAAPAGGVTFDIATAANTATAGTDYVTRTLTGQTIAAGGTTFAFTVQVNGDQVDELNETYFVNVTNATNATVTDGQGLGTITDDDVLGIVVAPTSGLSVTEAGSTATFTVVLSSQPTASVSIGLSSSDTTEATVAPASLTFTTANWNTAQTVTVTGVNDSLDDGDIAWNIVTAAASSADANYNLVNASNVSGTTVDDDAVGIVVAPTSGLSVTEAGTTATFTVVLSSQPTANVSIALSSSDTTEATVGPASLTFTSANWNIAQTVTATGVNDALDDGDIAWSIVTAAATSADAGYNGINASDVAGTTVDNDTAGITVVAAPLLMVTEAGGTATFTVVLDSQPTANVTIGVSSGTPGEASVAPASLVFDSANWNVAQTVTVTGVDDAIDDGDAAVSIVIAAATSADANYAGRNPADLAASNADNDTFGIVVAPTAGLTTTEAAGTAQFTIVLASQPTAGVSIALSSSDTTEGTNLPAAVAFTTANWNVPQTVVVTGVDDAIDDGDVAYSVITAAAVSADANYGGVNPSDVALANTDNDGAGIIVTPTAGLTTTEAGGTATFTVVLTSEPIANVVVGLSSSDTTEGTIAPASLTFTAANWNVAQTATVTGVTDAVDDGNIAYSIVTAAATSTDPNYAGANAADVMVTNTDDDTAGVTVTPLAGLSTNEGGGTATFTVVLTSQPLADVAIALSSSDTTEGTVAPAGLAFTAANWNVAQTVTVTGVNDAVDDGDIAYSAVTAAATSADPGYAGIDAGNVALTNIDNDGAGVIVSPTAGLSTTEGGATATFTVVLSSEPTATVTVPLSSSDLTEATVAPASLAFTAANWNVPQTVTITGVDDAVDDGDIAYTVVTAPAVSGDATYAGVDASNVAASNVDNDGAGITVTPTSGLVTTEGGGTATFTVALASQPTADVVIGVTSSDTTEATVAPATLTFTAANWNVAQTVTATGVNDALADGAIAYTIVTAAASSADPSYQGVNPLDVTASNADNDSAGITVSPTAGLVTNEAGGTATFTVVLNSQPTADVSLTLTGSDSTEGTIAPATLVFTSANWNQLRTITATGVDDLQFDGNIAWTVALGNATSTDPLYTGVAAGNVSLTNNDNDVDRFTGALVTGGGTGSVVIAGGMCSIDMAQSAFIGVGGLNIPTGTGFPHGALRLITQGCTVGASITVTLTLPTRPDGSVLLGLDATDPAVVRAAGPSGATSLQYTLVDGGPLDGDGVANGVIVDVVGLGVVQVGGNPGHITIPSSSDWSRLAMLLMIAMLGALALRRRAD